VLTRISRHRGISTGRSSDAHRRATATLEIVAAGPDAFDPAAIAVTLNAALNAINA
jgi:hypothetical protein